MTEDDSYWSIYSKDGQFIDFSCIPFALLNASERQFFDSIGLDLRPQPFQYPGATAKSSSKNAGAASRSRGSRSQRSRSHVAQQRFRSNPITDSDEMQVDFCRPKTEFDGNAFQGSIEYVEDEDMGEVRFRAARKRKRE